MKRGRIMKKYMLANLDCPFCAAKIEEGIKNLDCVKDAKVVFATKTLIIDTDDIHKVQEAVSLMCSNPIKSTPVIWSSSRL